MELLQHSGTRLGWKHGPVRQASKLVAFRGGSG